MPRGGLAAETLQEGLSWDALKDSVCVGARARPSAWAPFSSHNPFKAIPGRAISARRLSYFACRHRKGEQNKDDHAEEAA